MSSFLQEVRHAARGLISRPLFALVIVVTLALGIGANTAIFSVVNAVLVSPFPVPDAGRLAIIQATSAQDMPISVSVPNFLSWEEQNRSFSSIGGSRGATVNLTGGDRPERLSAAQTLGDLFGTLGVPPAMGRGLRPDETRRGAPRVAVLSDRLWKRSFGADGTILGTSIQLSGEPFTVVGVMPEGFWFPSPDTEIWLPMGAYADRLPWEERGNSSGMLAVGRLQDGLSLESAVADMNAVGLQVQQDTGWDGMPRVESLRDVALGPIEPALLVLFGAVGFVLLIACANVAHLVLARGEERQRELAVRAALGAGRGRLIRHLLTESLLLSLAGGGAGALLAAQGLRVLVSFLPDGLPFFDRVGLDGSVLVFTLGLSLLTGIIFGLLPAIQATRPDPNHALKEGGRTGSGSGRQRLRGMLVVAEMALALMLLVGAGLMLQSFNRLRDTDPGFDPDGVVSLRIALPDSDYDGLEDWTAFFENLKNGVETLPGVRSAAVNNGVPLASGGTESSSFPEGVSPDEARSTLYQVVSPDYFETLGIPLRAGRDFSMTDRDGAPLVAMVDESMAEAYWPGENPIGRRVSFERNTEGDTPVPIWREVIGVVGHVRHYELRSRSRPQIYVPISQPPDFFGSRLRPMALFVRTSGNPAAVVPSVRDEVRRLDAGLPVYDVRTMDEILVVETLTDRILGALMTVFAGIALLLAAVGIYGVLAYAVSRRTHEIGIRMALGAGTGDVLSLVLRRSMVLTAAGLGIGLLATFLLGRVLSSLLFEVNPGDPLTAAGVAALLATVALAATWLPARRAARTDPSVALRNE